MDIKTLTGSNLRADGPSSGSRSRGASTVAEEAGAKKAGPAGGESVKLTEAAQSMQAAREGAKEVPFDEAKVASIRAAIAEGRYPVDNEQLASRMLSFERLLSRA